MAQQDHDYAGVPVGVGGAVPQQAPIRLSLSAATRASIIEDCAKVVMSCVPQLTHDIVNSSISHYSREKKFEWKGTGNKEQYLANEAIDEQFQLASSVVEKFVEANPGLQKAVDVITTGRKLIHDRNKLIKIADRSSCGWAAANVYAHDQLASDSDDEKRIKKSEYRVERKIKEKRTLARRDRPYGKYQRGRSFNRFTSRGSFPYRGPVDYTPAAATVSSAMQLQPYVQPFRVASAGRPVVCYYDKPILHIT